MMGWTGIVAVLIGMCTAICITVLYVISLLADEEPRPDETPNDAANRRDQSRTTEVNRELG